MAIKSFHDPCIFQFYWFQNFKWKLRIRTHLLSPSKERNNKKKYTNSVWVGGDIIANRNEESGISDFLWWYGSSCKSTSI